MFRVASSEAGAWADGPDGAREADRHGAARAWFRTRRGRAGDFRVRPSSPPALLRARGYFGAQAIAGIVWWFAVFASDSVRQWTLGGWNPAVLVAPDLVLFVGASAVAALLGNRYFAGVAALWTVALTAALAIYGLVAHAAGWGVACMALASFGSVVAAATLWFGRVPTRWFFMGPLAFREAEERSSARNLRRSLTQLVVFWTTFFVVVPIVVASLERRLNLGLPFPHARSGRSSGSWSSRSRVRSDCGRASRWPYSATAPRSPRRRLGTWLWPVPIASCATPWPWRAGCRPQRSVSSSGRGWSSRSPSPEPSRGTQRSGRLRRPISPRASALHTSDIGNESAAGFPCVPDNASPVEARAAEANLGVRAQRVGPEVIPGEVRRRAGTSPPRRSARSRCRRSRPGRRVRPTAPRGGHPT